MQDNPTPEELPASLQFLRLMVMVLTGTMIAGLVVLIVLFVTRFPTAAVSLPDSITLPDGSTATAFTRGAGWYAIVTDDDEILIFNASDSSLRQRIIIE
ncbi:DUF6476 family protein [Cochlodiniinecator piscidefendens]|uniref:DUF6476 family protein n=1 Tax=Cochlodiniinecator piscidefendens TaxID=2715756 RepID=UPI001407724C|nr:DUF6476 family protein [Cochlodiniinecator piscidefendens]